MYVLQTVLLAVETAVRDAAAAATEVVAAVVPRRLMLLPES